MVQVSFDTNADALEDLQDALRILQQAIERRGGKAPQQRPQPEARPAHPETTKFDMSNVEQEADKLEKEIETALETPFLKITLEKHEQHKEQHPEQKMPTLNQLINDESLNEDDLGKLFKAQQAQEEEEKKLHPEKHVEKKSAQSQDAYIEIIEYDKEKD